MAVAAILFFVVTIFWIYILWSRRKYYAFALKIPGPLGLPFIGIVLKFANLSDVLYEFPKYAIQHKVKTYTSWLGPYLFVYTIDPKVAEIILNSADCINKSVIYDVINDVVGSGLLTSKSPDWNVHRKLINPSFSHKVLLSFVPLFNEESRQVCNTLEKNVNCGEVNIKQIVCNLSLRTAVATTMGLDYDENANKKFLEVCEQLLMLVTQRVLNPFLSNKLIFRASKMYKPYCELKGEIMGFVHDLVMKKLEAFEKNGYDSGTKNNIFIDFTIKLHQNKNFTINDVIAESSLMVIAAFETTATTMFTTLMCLAMFPQYQEKVFEEIKTIFPDTEFDVNCEDFKNLVYLEMCINETLRCFSSVPIVARVCSKDVPISKDIVIPEGTQIFVDMFNIHRDEDIWGPNAHTFNPDNFLPENLVGKHSYAFMPFLKGPRNCIGWQYAKIFLKVCLVQVLRKYRFSTSFQFQDLRCAEHITLRYEKLPHLEVHRR